MNFAYGETEAQGMVVPGPSHPSDHWLVSSWSPVIGIPFPNTLLDYTTQASAV